MKKYQSKKIILFLFCCSLFIVSCSMEYDDFSSAIIIENETKQQQLVSELLKIGIPFKLDSKRIWFNPRDQKIVDDITYKVMANSSSYNSTSFSYSDPKYTDILINKLHENKIPYLIEVIDGKKRIVLQKQDAEKWEPHKQVVDEMYLQVIQKTVNN